MSGDYFTAESLVVARESCFCELLLLIELAQRLYVIRQPANQPTGPNPTDTTTAASFAHAF
jgi:hypothetical protein